VISKLFFLAVWWALVVIAGINKMVRTFPVEIEKTAGKRKATIEPERRGGIISAHD
jgi:hypothetical protein